MTWSLRSFWRWFGLCRFLDLGFGDVADTLTLNPLLEALSPEPAGVGDLVFLGIERPNVGA